MGDGSSFFLIHRGSGGPSRFSPGFYSHQLTSRAFAQRRLPTEHAAYWCRQKTILVFLPSTHGRIEKRQAIRLLEVPNPTSPPMNTILGFLRKAMIGQHSTLPPPPLHRTMDELETVAEDMI